MTLTAAQLDGLDNLAADMLANGLGEKHVMLEPEVVRELCQLAREGLRLRTGGWTNWPGGIGCPVEATVRVNVIFRDGESYGDPCEAGELTWAHDGSVSDIVAYRVVPPLSTAVEGDEGK